MKLLNESVEFRISTTGVEVKYTDDGESVIRLCAKKINNEDELYLLEMQFQCVAEIDCKTINFYESNYKNYQIIGKDGVELHDGPTLSGFYKVIDSSKLASSKETYDPTGSLDLKHYLVTGGDSYFEILASGYSINVVSSSKNS